MSIIWVLLGNLPPLVAELEEKSMVGFAFLALSLA